ncbi:MAG: hypothetical protein PHE50_04690 [Dehalococcoidales bacterium]|nr:hypothetical protein [Dehalococcoidales bacterium]
MFFSSKTITEIPLVALVGVIVLAGLWLANFAFDHGVPNYVSRKIGHGAGGIAFLLSIYFSTAGWPVIIAAGFGIILLALRFTKPHLLRGVGGTARSKKVMAEIWFPWVAVPVFLLAWFRLDKPAVAVTCLLFMAWGDGITGLVRARVYRKPVKGFWGSLAMLGVCLLIAGIFIKPFWIGAVASGVAVITESAFGEYGFLKWGDDNWAIPLTSMATILGLMAITGII